MGAKLFLHIGRNRTGSTTLQNTWLRHAEVLRAGGVQYALFGQENPPGHDLPSFSSHMALVQYVQDHPSSGVLISHEGLCCFRQDFAMAMAADIAKLDVTLIFYVRPYRDWVVSDYTFNVLIGQQAEDFDAYLQCLGERVRFWPALRIWGDAVGWDRVRIRSLHPDDLADGDLASDGMAAIGFPTSFDGSVRRDNGSPAWVSTELIRALLTGPFSTRQSVENPDVNKFLQIGELIDYGVRLAGQEEGMDLDRGSYLTPDQAYFLRRSYNDDLDVMSMYTKHALRYDDCFIDSCTRAFLPSAQHVSPQFIRSLIRGLEEKAVLAKLVDVAGECRVNILSTLSHAVY